jgi:hypothetical protein
LPELIGELLLWQRRSEIPILTFAAFSGGPTMDEDNRSGQNEENRSGQNDHLIHRLNQVFSGIVACAVLGVAGFMAYQNRDSLKPSDSKGGVLGSFLNKKFTTATTFSQSNLPEFQTPDWEKTTLIDPSKLMGNQFGPTQFPTATNSSSRGRRR